MTAAAVDTGNLLVNLSVLMEKPTGITVYARNVYPFLKPLNPILAIARPDSDFACYPIPGNMTPNQGSRGHLRRLAWTELALPRIYRNTGASLLFSPLPEAPLLPHCRQVVMVHDLIPLRFPRRFSPLTPYFRAYIPQVLRQSLHIICNSQATARDISQFWGISATKITPIPLAYDRDRFFPQTCKNPSLPPYFLYLGRPDPHKNLPRLLTAFARMRSRDCQLWLAGPSDPRYTPRLQQQAGELGIEDRVRFLDYVPHAELPQLVGCAIGLVFPSLWEGFGFPVLEAMACGTAAIASNLSSLPELMGDAGLSIDPYNPLELAAAMDELMENSNLRSQLKERGICRAAQFSWQKTGEATLNILRSLL